jgi:hypothetical protein
LFSILAAHFVLGKELGEKLVQRFDMVRIRFVPELMESQVIHEFFMVLFHKGTKFLVPRFASEP